MRICPLVDVPIEHMDGVIRRMISNMHGIMRVCVWCLALNELQGEPDENAISFDVRVGVG